MAKCDCGARLKHPKSPAHLRGEKHQAWMGAGFEMAAPIVVPANGLDPALQGVIDATHLSPQERAKLCRQVFSALGWPNSKHPGTVRDFLIQHDILIIEVPRLVENTESKVGQYVAKANASTPEDLATWLQHNVPQQSESLARS